MEDLTQQFQRCFQLAEKARARNKISTPSQYDPQRWDLPTHIINTPILTPARWRIPAHPSNPLLPQSTQDALAWAICSASVVLACIDSLESLKARFTDRVVEPRLLQTVSEIREVEQAAFGNWVMARKSVERESWGAEGMWWEVKRGWWDERKREAEGWRGRFGALFG